MAKRFLRERIHSKQTNYTNMQSAWPASANGVPKVSTKCPENVRNRLRNVAGVKACNESIQNHKNMQSAWFDTKTDPKLGGTCPQQITPKRQKWVVKRPRRIKTPNQPTTRNQHGLLAQMGRQRYPINAPSMPPEKAENVRNRSQNAPTLPLDKSENVRNRWRKVTCK